ncbi:ANTAR domain-containing protein [Shewanella maritima]|uniref:ANTAR domain-containing protein n=1 Tax=Shewanella maritima TaxID=2520507 RepID=UPI0037358062
MRVFCSQSSQSRILNIECEAGGNVEHFFKEFISKYSLKFDDSDKNNHSDKSNYPFILCEQLSQFEQLHAKEPQSFMVVVEEASQVMINTLKRMLMQCSVPVLIFCDRNAIAFNALKNEAPYIQVLPSFSYLTDLSYWLECSSRVHEEFQLNIMKVDHAVNALTDNQCIYRAKLLLIEQGLTEAKVHKMLQQHAMKQGVSMALIAKSLIEQHSALSAN